MPPLDIIPKPQLPWQLSDPARARAKLAAYLAEADANAADPRMWQGAADFAPDDRGGPMLGLSTAHIPPLPRLINHVGGELTQLKGNGPPPPQGTKRGIITGFSRGSRLRLQHKLASLNRDVLTPRIKFITLTYPAEFPTSPVLVKAHFDAFLKRLERKFGKWLIIWRLELQARGAPHFHLLVFCPDFIPYRWVAAAWNNIVAPTDWGHLQAGTQIKGLHTWRGAARYVAKYMSKEQDKHDGYKPAMGRLWGMRNLEAVHIQVEELTLSWPEFYAARRVLCKVLERKTGQPQRRGAYNQGRGVFIPYADGVRLAGWLESGAWEPPP